MSPLYLLILAATIQASYTKNCSDGWLDYQDYCYLFHHVTATLQGQTMKDALLSCQQYGGSLLSVRDKAENDFIAKQFNDIQVQRQHYWIGLNDIDTEGTFVWTDNTNYTFSNWHHNEPNNFMNKEDCVEATYDGGWNDDSCDRLYGFICKVKKDAVPLTTTLPPIPTNTDKPVTCEAGWIPWGTSCYGIITGLYKSWSDARADCLRRFGDLLIINSTDEQNFIANEISLYDTAGYWIGLSDTYQENNFFWVNREKLDKSLAYWRPNEPSNSFGNEDCVEMHGRDSGRWNDNHCSALRNYICEKVSGVHNCPDGWLSYNDFCYQINAHPDQRLTYADAESECHSFNEPWKDKVDVAKAELTSILSKNEQKMLVEEFKKLGVSGFGKYFWIGLNKSEDKTFSWTDSSKLNFTNYDASFWTMTSGNCVSSSLENTDGKWFLSSCDDKLNYVCKVQRGKDRCYNPMGMQSFEIPNSAITASVQLSVTTPPAAARLYMKKGNSFDGAWCGKNISDLWLQIDFGQTEKITYLAYQGKSNSRAFVTSFLLHYSIDGVSWDIYGDHPPLPPFRFGYPNNGRTDYERVYPHQLLTPLFARYVRIYPLDWIDSPCMRVEFYGCSQDKDSQACGVGWRKDAKSKNCYKMSNQKTTWDSANSICFADGSNLLSITNPDELLYVNKELETLYGKSDLYWIGLNDLDSKGIYKWSDQSSTSLVNWYTMNPTSKSLKTRCVSIRSNDGFWINEDCNMYRTFICKKKNENPYEIKESFNSNWRSSSDYYWPLDVVSGDNKTVGTIAAEYFGAAQPYPLSLFPVTFSNNQSRSVLSFNGKDNYLKAVVESICAVNPISDYCPHGLTVSVLFKCTLQSLPTKTFIIDSVKGSTVGYSIYIAFGKVNVLVVGSNIYYLQSSYYSKYSWNHLAFTFSSQNGLSVFINGELKVTQTYSLKNNVEQLPQPSKTLYFAKSRSSEDFSKIELSSVAIFERELSSAEINKIYVSEFGKCGWGQEEVGTSCYSFNLSEMVWSLARDACEQNGGNLASINNPIEQALISLRATQKLFLNGMWIGLNSKQQNHVYNWTDGSALSFSFWNTMEPNNWVGRREDCVHTTVNGHWNDDLCELKKPFICKYSRKIIPYGVEEQDSLHSINFWYYQTQTFGCPLTKRIIIKSVYYGNDYMSCFLPQNESVIAVQQACSGPVCPNIRASDDFFKKKGFCNGVSKKMNLTYSCAEDESMSSSNECPKGYIAHDRSCFKLYTHQANLTEGLLQCKNDAINGNLASIHSREEELFLTTMLGALYTKTDVWLGMKYDPAYQVYTWMNKNSVTYTNWLNKQPDPRDEKIYIKLSLYNGADDFLFWQAAKLEEKMPFICQTLKVNTTETPPLVTSGNTQQCEAGWVSYQDNCYIVNNNSLSFHDAEEACSKMGENGHLASVTSFELNSILFDALYNSSLDFAWFGLSNEGLINGFMWLDGTPLSFINWYTNSPYTGMQHLCAGMQNGGKWQDMQCYLQQASFCQVPKGKVFSTTRAPPVTPTQDLNICPSNWKLYRENCYYFSNNTYLDWHNAALACEAANSSLTSIQDVNETNFIAAELKRRNMQNAYIGLNDLFHESGWQWLDGSIANYFNFKSLQPDNWQGMEDCVEIDLAGYWNDVSCNLKKPYVCERFNNTVPARIKPSISPTAAPDKNYCEDNWILYGSKCYLFKYGAANRLKFKDAENLCQSMNASLTSIHSEFEHFFLLSQLYNAHEPIYIGLSDRQVERTFLWNDQSSVDYTNWYIGQPSWFGDEDCVEMMPYFLQQGRWNDINCENENGYICSKTSSPSPPATVNSTETGITCPQGYKLYQTSCYKLVLTPMSWENARMECKKDNGGNLVSVHSPFEQAFLTSYFGENSTLFWIGLHKHKDEDQLHWEDNTPLDFKYWQAGQSYIVPKNQERCVAHQYKVDNKYPYSKGTWKNDECSTMNPFVCKITNKEFEGKPEFKGNCSAGWSKYNDFCYKLFSDYSDRVTWSEARERCSNYGGNLVTISSQDIQNHLRTMIREGWSNVWIGLNDQAKEGVFKWSSNEFFSKDSYKNWAQNEPNDIVGKENCVEMSVANGQWNDNLCSDRLSFMCEHSLECIDDLGMVSKDIPDSNINATSYAPGFAPSFARLNYKYNNKDVAWCTNVTDGKQSITINLGEFMTVTRISTQGLVGYGHVILYLLEYSSDGINWNVYSEDTDDSKLIRANSNSQNIDGFKVMMEALFIRITPKKFFGNYICLRLEFYGCKSVCSKALGMQNHLIRDEDLSASSTLEGFPVTYGRLFGGSNSVGWCAKTNDSNPWYQIDLQTPHKITRVSATGKGTLLYELNFSDDGINWENYQTLNGLVKLFSIEHKTYELQKEQIKRYVRFLPKKWNKDICLQVELFGCTYECDTSLGLESLKIPDNALSASSSRTKNPPQKARLNLGDYNSNGWCAQKKDKNQYLQVSLNQLTRITYVATQGSDGDTPSYVTKYRLQWSSDRDFWSTFFFEITGNNDGQSVVRFKLPNPIIAQYIRINPVDYVNEVCMRIELYGCSLESQVVSTESPSTKTESFFGSFRLTDVSYSEALSDLNSQEFKNLAYNVKSAIENIYIGTEEFKDGFNSVTISSFSAGSVIVNFKLVFNSLNIKDPLKLFKEEIAKGQLANHKVDKSSLKITQNPGKNVQPDSKDGGLSSGGKIGLAIFFIIIVAVIAATVVYILRKKHVGFKHKAFENPIHYESDELNVKFMKDDSYP